MLIDKTLQKPVRQGLAFGKHFVKIKLEVDMFYKLIVIGFLELSAKCL